jgi:hypothetical protein
MHFGLLGQKSRWKPTQRSYREPIDLRIAQVTLRCLVNANQALAAIRIQASAGTVALRLGPDELLWGLGAIGGYHGLCDSLTRAIHITAEHDEFMITVDGFEIWLAGDLAVTGIAPA